MEGYRPAAAAVVVTGRVRRHPTVTGGGVAGGPGAVILAHMEGQTGRLAACAEGC